MGESNAKRKHLQVAFIAPNFGDEKAFVEDGILTYSRTLLHSDFDSPDDLINRRYVDDLIENVTALIGSNSANIGTVSLPTFIAANLVQDGNDWYLDLSNSNVPDMPKLFLYVDNGDGLGKQALIPNYRNITKRLYGFNDPTAFPNQLIYVSYIGELNSGGGTNPGTGTPVFADGRGGFYTIAIDPDTLTPYPVPSNATAPTNNTYSDGRGNNYTLIVDPDTLTITPVRA